MLRRIDKVTILKVDDPLNLGCPKAFSNDVDELLERWKNIKPGVNWSDELDRGLDCIVNTAALLEGTIKFALCHELAHACDGDIAEHDRGTDTNSVDWRCNYDSGFSREIFADDMAMSHFVEVADVLNIRDDSYDFALASCFIFRCFAAVNHIELGGVCTRGYPNPVKWLHATFHRMLLNDQRGFEHNGYVRAAAAISSEYFRRQGNHTILGFDESKDAAISDPCRTYHTLGGLIFYWYELFGNGE